MTRWNWIEGSQAQAEIEAKQTYRLVAPSGRSADKPIIVATCMWHAIPSPLWRRR